MAVLVRQAERERRRVELKRREQAEQGHQQAADEQSGAAHIRVWRTHDTSASSHCQKAQACTLPTKHRLWQSGGQRTHS